MYEEDLLESLTELEVNDKEDDPKISGGGVKGVKLYPLGECRICSQPLPQTDPLDICFRCQGKGLMGNPREPIDKNKKR